MSFARKLRRSQSKKFKKDYKKTMSKWKKSVRCGVCGREPYEGEKIDNWRIKQESANIDLVCESCHMEQQLEERGVQE